MVNENPQVVKELRSIAFEGSTPPDYVHFRNIYPYIQSSDLVASDFNSRESIHDGAVLRDRLDPNQSSVNEALYKGAFMRGQFPQVYFELTDTDDQFIIRFIDVNYTISSGHMNI